ncbi:hypothetical protein FUAX_08130 [Fulvitalea axinellae]|uniref:LysM domain-containing protein n=1 Tax=Fulvitalea axinellae TaxID=1182444 RepID=A0AAU9D6D2_9BACT|nr:hypothetical protein FUAX_08130 [Fulvitalea axinellae]
MVRSLKCLFAVIVVSLVSFADVEARVASPKDSVGVENIQGKNFILHKVSKGEGLYGIARRYKISVNQLKEANPSVTGGLSLGQIIKVPYAGVVAKPQVATAAVEAAPASPKEVVHVVKASETLFSLAKRYGVSVADIKSWNGMQSNALALGQRLVVGKGSSASSWKSAAGDTLGLRPKDPKEAVGTMDLGNVIGIDEKRKVDENGRVTEVGIAKIIPDSEDSPKYLALHRDAPVGTIIHMKNESNNLNIFVRVIGRLPDTGDNEKVLIRISQVAYERLGAVNSAFPVQLSYILEQKQ